MLKKWFIVDAHQHIRVGTYIYASQIPRETEEEQLKREITYFKEWFERYGVAYGAVSNISPMVDRVWKSRHGGNEAVAELVKHLNGKVIGQYVPNVFEPPDIVKEKTEEAIRDLGFKGIKMHPWVSAFPLNHPMVYPVLDVAAKYRICLLYTSPSPRD